MSVADNEFNPCMSQIIYPILGYLTYSAEKHDKAVADLKKLMAMVNAQLSSREYLLGSQVTLADIILVCTLVSLYKMFFDAEFRAAYPKTNAWFTRCCNLPEFKSVLGEVVLCEVAQQCKA